MLFASLQVNSEYKKFKHSDVPLLPMSLEDHIDITSQNKLNNKLYKTTSISITYL